MSEATWTFIGCILFILATTSSVLVLTKGMNMTDEICTTVEDFDTPTEIKDLWGRENHPWIKPVEPTPAMHALVHEYVMDKGLAYAWSLKRFMEETEGE